MIKSKIPTFLGIFILTLGIAAGVFLLQQNQTFRLGASGSETPKNVRITNIADTSFTISWTTDKPSVGYIKYGTTNPTEIIRPLDQTSKSIHSITLSSLTPSTSYQVSINSGGDDHNNNGLPWQTTTGSTLSSPASTQLISGKVLLPSGEPAPNILVYLTSGGISPLSTTTSLSGEWNIPISNARTTLLSSYVQLQDQTLLELFIEGGPLSIATAQIFFSSANPTPPITLGQVYDFRSDSPNPDEGAPKAELALPTQPAIEAESGFQVSDDTQPETETVSLESVDDDEIVFTTTPEFFGTGPAGETITITVESANPQTDNVVVNPDGSWDWTPPENLEEGDHTVTISWRDATGILRKLTKSFTVQAAEGEPSFESTPSGSSPTPTATSSPTPTPSSSPSASPTATPRISIPSTDSAIPESGNPLPTILFTLTGLLLIGAGIGLSIKLN